MRRQWLNIKLTSLKKKSNGSTGVNKSRPKLKEKRKIRELSRYKLTSPEKATFYRLHDWSAEMLKFQNPIIFRLPKELFTTCLSVCLSVCPIILKTVKSSQGYEGQEDIRVAEPSADFTHLLNQINRYSHQSTWKVFWFVTFICSYKNFKQLATWEYVTLDKLNLHFRTKVIHLWLQKKLPFTQRWELFLQQWFWVLNLAKARSIFAGGVTRIRCHSPLCQLPGTASSNVCSF